MFYDDGTPRDYQMRASLTSNSYSRSVGNTWGVETSAIVRISWGIEYSAGATGIDAQVRTWVAFGTSTENYQATLTTPWGTYTTATGTGYPASYLTKIELDDVEFSVAADCDAWSFAFSELRWYVDGALTQTITAKSLSGTGYDERWNLIENISDGSINPEQGVALPGCEESARDVRIFAQNNPGGYRYRTSAGPGAWTSDAVTLASIAVPTPVWDCSVELGTSCTCTESLPTISGTDSWSTVTEVDSRNILTYTDLGIVALDCDPPGPLPWKFQVDQWDLDYYRRASVLGIKPEGGGILKRTEYAGAACWCQDPPPAADESTTTTTGTVTHASSIQLVRSIEATRQCCTTTQFGACPLVTPEEPVPIPPDAPCDEWLCAYYAVARSNWPEEPPCPGCTQADLAWHPTGRWLSCQVCAGKIQISRSGNVLPLDWTATTSAVSADWVKCKPQPAGVELWLWMLYKDGSTIYLSRTLDEGATIGSGMPITIDSGGTYTGGDIVIPAEYGRIHVYYVDGTTIYVKVVDADTGATIIAETSAISSIDSGSFVAAAVGYGPQGDQRFVLEYLDGGAVTTSYSLDGISSWS